MWKTYYEVQYPEGGILLTADSGIPLRAINPPGPEVRKFPSESLEAGFHCAVSSGHGPWCKLHSEPSKTILSVESLAPMTLEINSLSFLILEGDISFAQEACANVTD